MSQEGKVRLTWEASQGRKKAKAPAPSWSRGRDLLGLEEETEAVPQQRTLVFPRKASGRLGWGEVEAAQGPTDGRARVGVGPGQSLQRQ